MMVMVMGGDYWYQVLVLVLELVAGNSERIALVIDLVRV